MSVSLAEVLRAISRPILRQPPVLATIPAWKASRKKFSTWSSLALRQRTFCRFAAHRNRSMNSIISTPTIGVLKRLQHLDFP